MEVWKDVEGFEDYEVSNTDKIKSWKGNKNPIILKGGIKGHGYRSVNLCKNGKKYQRYVHILVAQAFIPNPLNLPEVNHKDGNKLNNNDWNLEWCTTSDNGKHAYKIGLQIPIYGEDNVKAKLTEKQVLEIRALKGIMPYHKIGEIYGVSKSLIGLIQLRKAWQHI